MQEKVRKHICIRAYVFRKMLDLLENTDQI